MFLSARALHGGWNGIKVPEHFAYDTWSDKNKIVLSYFRYIGFAASETI